MFWLRPRASIDRSPWGSFWFEPIGVRSFSGARITGESAMRLAAVYACVRLLSKSFAMCPFGLFRKEGADGRTRTALFQHPLYRLLAKRPNKWQNPYEWREMCMGHLALRGNAYNEIYADGAGVITDLIPRHPDRVLPEVLPTGDYRYKVQQADGTWRIVPRGAMWHMRGLSSDGIVGLSPIDCARETVGIGLAAQEYGARFFLNDGRPGSGWIEHPSKFLNKEERDLFRESWQASQTGENRHKTAVLEAGMKYHDMAVNNEQAQFLETRKFSVSDIARMFGVPPHLIGDLDRATFNNIEQQSIEFVQFTMAPITEAWEASIEYTLLDDETGDLETDFALDRLLRGDFAGRGDFYTKMFAVGAFSTNDIRFKEGMNPVDGGDERFVPVNLQTLEKAAATEEPEPGAQAPQLPADPTPAKPPARKSERLLAMAQSAVERVIRRELEMRRAGRVDMVKHTQFVADVLAILPESAEQYCEKRLADFRGACEEFEAIGRAALLALAIGETCDA